MEAINQCKVQFYDMSKYTLNPGTSMNVELGIVIQLYLKLQTLNRYMTIF